MFSNNRAGATFLAAVTHLEATVDLIGCLRAANDPKWPLSERL